MALLAAPPCAQAQESGYGQTLGTYGNEQLQKPFDEPMGLESILDATNPLDLMNRIRRATALDDATPPNTAIDAALMEFEAQQSAAGEAGIQSATPSGRPSFLPAAGQTPSQPNF